MSSSDRWTDKSKTSECISWKVSHSHSSLQFRWWTGYLGLTEKVILCLWHDQGRSDKNSWNKRYWWFVIYNHWLSIYFEKFFKTVKLQIKSNSGEILISKYTIFVKMLCNKWKVLLCIFDLFFAGREERYFDKFHVSPDGKHLIFLGTNGYIILLSSKVSLLPYNQSTCMRSAKAPWPITKTLPKINKFVRRVPVIIVVIT